MWERDYILRMIHEVSQVLARVAGLRKGGDDEGALDVIEEAYVTLGGLSAMLVNGVSEDDLLGLLRTRGVLDADRCFALSDLLREEADIYEDDDQPEESFPRYLKSLRLLLELAPELEGPFVDMAASRLDELLDRLASFELPPEALLRLLKHFEAVGRYDRAEDTAWELIETAPGPGSISPVRQFYERLLALPDDALAAGGLPRDEVREGLARLQSDLDD